MGQRPKGGVFLMKNYEIMFIIRPNMEDDAKKTLVDNFTNVLTSRDAVVDKVENWGVRNLAYEIGDYRKGNYALITAKAPVEAINEFDRLARISEDIIRYIIVKDEE
ncbi:MAG: rpsF [Haloplasmataceae bacterium]|jgi:small subunit ribosomal protein S6|nr:rpsF [Haloplasmataceae bacterium]